MGLKTKTAVEKYKLSPESIDKISTSIKAFCDNEKIESRVALRHRLSAEESLETWMNQCGDNQEVALETGTKLHKPFFKLTVGGKQVNPYEVSDSSEGYEHEKNGFLLRIGLIPEYSYANGKNILTFRPKRKQASQIVILLSVILLACFAGVLGKLCIPQSLLSTISTGFVSPIESAFFRVLSSIAGPMIFLSVAWGVYGIGDVYTLGRIGKKMMLAFFKVVFLFSLFGLVFYPLLGPALSDAVQSENQFSKIFEMLLSIIPANIFSPFEDGNTLQIIFLALIIGTSMIFLGQRTSSVARAVEQINYIISFLMEFISKMVPFFIFIVLVNLIWSDSLPAFSKVWKLALVFLLSAITGQILFLLYICIKHKQKPIKMIGCILPSYLIALTTASSSASFESNINICDTKLGIKKALSSFGVPFGMVVFKPISAIYYLLICFYFASANNITASLGWIATAVIITAVTSVAVPPIPGGATAVYSILFLQLGIPSTSLALVLAVDMLFDFIITPGNIFMLLLEMFNLSKKLGMNNGKLKNIDRTEF